MVDARWEVVDVRPGPHATNLGARGDIVYAGWVNELDITMRKGTVLAIARWLFLPPWECIDFVLEDPRGLRFSGILAGGAFTSMTEAITDYFDRKRDEANAAQT